MREECFAQIEKIVDILYSPDKVGVDEAFVELLDKLFVLIEKEGLAESAELNQILLELQNAYAKKDLVDLADVLLYRLKVYLEQ
jgi:CRISPR/Cas system-associated protein Csm6